MDANKVIITEVEDEDTNTNASPHSSSTTVYVLSDEEGTTTTTTKRREAYNDDGVPTHTSMEQESTEKSIAKFYYSYRQNEALFSKSIKLLRQDHINYCLKGLDYLSPSYDCLDASRTWLCYWILHSLDLLGCEGFEQKYGERVVSFLSRCQNPTGGYGGGPGQLSHLAPTYSAINSLVIIGTESAYNSINREALYKFLLSLKTPEGGFKLHHDGEVDIRGVYTALAVASLCDILTPELASGVDQFIKRCQTYEGGIAAYPGNEAHGGYAFCGLAAALLLKKVDALDLDTLLHWCVQRQTSLEGGFQGRTHKLCDACYSFWMGGTFPLLQGLIAAVKSSVSADEASDALRSLQWKNPLSQNVTAESDPNYTGEWLFDETALQEYILLCCQVDDGGLRDKPGKGRDYYHTCYALSGLSVAQHTQKLGKNHVLGDHCNLLRETSPIFNICKDKVRNALRYFGNREYV